MQLQHHGERVGRGDAGNVVEQGLARLVARIRRFGPFKSKQHGRSIKDRAVMEVHARLQAKGVGLAVGRHLPRLRQQGRCGTALLNPGQAFEHVVVHHLANRRGRCAGRVQAVGLQRWAIQGSPSQVHFISLGVKH